MTRYPFCSLIVLNYYGEKVIKGTLNSLLNLNYPKNKYEIIVVDNNSPDKSKKILSKYSKIYKQVKTIFLNNNLGFSKGNNIGIRNAKGDYIALLNNDCIVDQDWIKELVTVAEEDSQIFAVNSKIKLYPKYLKVRLKCRESFLIGECYLTKSKLCKYALNNKILIKLNVKDNVYSLEVPFDPIVDHRFDIEILASVNDDKEDKLDLRLPNIPKELYRVSFTKASNKNFLCTIRFNIPKNKFKNSYIYDFIQNSGIVVFQNGYGRDIGAIVRYHQQFYEKDLGQYDQKREVYAACGAAVLYRKKVLDKIGFFDEAFFMYYEDVDISERARLYGYKIIYTPKAVVRHKHALSSQEWSPFFVYHVEKGRLLHIIYNFPLKVFFKEYLMLFINLIFYVGSVLLDLQATKKVIKLIFADFGNKDKTEESNRLINKFQVLKVLLFFFINIPFLIIKRNRKLSHIPKAATRDNYQKILKGEWYFI